MTDPMTAAEQAIRHGGRMPYANAPDPGIGRAVRALLVAMDEFNTAAERAHRARTYPERAAAARAAHDAGQHTTPTIGKCPSCLAEYVTTPPEGP